MVMGDQNYIQGSTLRISLAGPFSCRESECVLWTCEGKETEEIGLIASISSRTVKAHLHSAMQKLGASNRAHLVSIVYVLGLVKPLPNAAARITEHMGRALAIVAILASVLASDDSMIRTRSRRNRSQLANSILFNSPSEAGGAPGATTAMHTIDWRSA